MEAVRLGGLFSGVGGFELAWQQLGHEVAWMCEIDPSARKVLQARFPDVPVYEDVEQLDPDEVAAVDIVTGGSPCQGFSIAGARTGLEHGESRLFADYVRIIDGLAARGLRWAVWENVPGVLSIEDEDEGEHTFEHVVTALAGGTVPVRLRRDKRWNTGMAAGRRRAVAWRVLDSRYFGVAQRRRRLFACVAIGDTAEDRAGRALLALPEGVRRNPAPSDEAWASTARLVGGSVEDSRISGTVSVKWQKGTGGPAGSETGNLVKDAPAVLLTMREGAPGGGKGPLLSHEQSLTLATGNGQTLFQPQQPLGFRKSRRAQSVTDAESWIDDGQANTLDTINHGDIRTIHAVVEPEYGVRRLTPVECERLQGFPDGWTEPAGSDNARYKAMGNAVTVNTVRWVLRRVLEQS